MCREDVGWDERLSDDLLTKWDQWKAELPELRNMMIRRCIKPDNFGEVVRRELHHFSDASFSGYGQCSYVRLIDNKKRVHCSLVLGKARVPPRKVVTMPRLELTAALVSVRVSSLLHSEMKHDVEEYFWTDSKVVLGYIHNDARRFHVFVANRVQQIRDRTRPQQWRYVKTDENPADPASRGLNARDLAESNWLQGPAFLWNCDLPPEEQIDTQTLYEDPEVRKVRVHASSTKEENVVLKRIQNFSDWQRVVKAVTLLRRFVSCKVHGKEFVRISPSSEEDRQETCRMIIQLLQREAFAEEIRMLERSYPISTKSKLYKLDPFLDEDGILRVGGRLVQSSLLYGVKHPMLLPRKSHVTELIIKFHHERVSHQGRGMTVGELRSSGYWILGCTKAVSSHIHKCVPCRKMRGKAQGQKMANLPTERLEPTPPFTHCGIDCFGPFMVKEGRKELKKWGLLVTCLVSRAVHVESLDDMSTDAFINGLRCFIALRGPPRSIRCDQGSNFVGAAHELKLALKELKEEKIRNYLTQSNCDFIMNSPSSSHMGGVWERQIRTIRSVLTAILMQHSGRLDPSSLRTFLYEAMAIVNSRPLSAISLNDPCGPEPLTPNHLLTMKSKVVLPPPGNFTKEDVYA